MRIGRSRYYASSYINQTQNKHTNELHITICNDIYNTVITNGDKAVKCAGFFGNDWSIEKGDFKWK